MSWNRKDAGWARLLLALLLALSAAGCATTQVVTRPSAAPRLAPAFAEAAALARNHAALAGQARVDNGIRIERLLAGIDDATLARDAAALPAGDPLYDFVGRALLNRGLPLPRPFDRGGNWRFDAGNRPPADSDGYRPPMQLGVLLPLSGSLSTAAGPVRDGLLAGYYAEQRRRPDIAFYDTADTAGGTLAAYDKAVAAGADYVLGPLGRDEVDTLFRSGRLTVPVLALNRGNMPPPPGSASFSLAPEDDGSAAAEYLIARKAPRVLVLADGDDGTRRAVAAFREQLQARGGTVVAEIGITSEPGDLAPALATAVQKDGGVDAVFLALKPAQARALAPQLVLAGLGGKLRVATSQLASASSELTKDHALDGIAFPSEAWAVRNVTGLPSAASAASQLPNARGGAAKLFAFGYDAWLLTAYLERLANDANGKVEGATGTLRIDGFGNVVRTPAWSTYSGATAVPLGNAGG
ncbi:penicillin-binding protein activator [Luteimonas sp. 50]|uniref:Penicillin-binding protein activator n=1 Tax=Cognatiluteimonas sedimenti TaxID=2927791 RepID=A0ABT0A3X6_9GAMM|nr:penicillin-binding protein activator [Lysobacter sedimenti]